jgi:glycosyltransferase involved in cell wall biosynthesis
VGDDAELASALRRVLTEPELAGRLRAAGHVVADRHSWAAEAERHARLYQRFLAPAARSDP